MDNNTLKILFHSINAHHECQVCSIGCCCLQNGCQLHYHAADSVLTSGCSFISQQIWIKLFVMLVILGKHIKIEKSSNGKRSMYIHISGWHTFDFGSVTCLIVTWWNCWRLGWMWHWFWCQLSESLWWRCTCAFASPSCLGILCCAIMTREAAVYMIFPKHSRVSSHRSFPIYTVWKHNSTLLLFWDFGRRFLNKELHFLYCGLRKPSFGHFGHIQGQAHVRVFWLYPTSLPCHSCRHVDNLQEISCCIYILDSAITSTIYASAASSKVVKACLVHSRGFLSLKSPTKIPELTTSWCSISRTVRTNALVDDWGFPLPAAINWSRSSLHTLAVCYIISWQPYTSIQLHIHPMGWCFILLRLLVLRTLVNCASWVIFSVAAFAGSQCTMRCLRCS